MLIQTYKDEELQEIQDRVESHSSQINSLVNKIIEPYVSGLDKYVTFISNCLKDGNQAPTDEELEDFCLNLSTQIYFASGACEQLGIRDDMSKEVYKEVFNTFRDEVTGTIADKDAYAELNAQKEQIINIAYARAYKILKSKIDNAQEMLNSCKKVLTRRTECLALSKMTR